MTTPADRNVGSLRCTRRRPVRPLVWWVLACTVVPLPRAAESRRSADRLSLVVDLSTFRKLDVGFATPDQVWNSWPQFWCDQLVDPGTWRERGSWMMSAHEAATRCRALLRSVERGGLPSIRLSRTGERPPVMSSAPRQFAYALKAWSWAVRGGNDETPAAERSARFRHAAEAFQAVTARFPGARLEAGLAHIGVGLTNGATPRHLSLVDLNRAYLECPPRSPLVLPAAWHLSEALIEAGRRAEAVAICEVVAREHGRFRDWQYFLLLAGRARWSPTRHWDSRTSVVGSFHWGGVQRDAAALGARLPAPDEFEALWGGPS
jgi:hypothetical protein